MKHARLWKRILHEGLNKKGAVLKDLSANDRVTESIIKAPLIVGPTVGEEVEGEPLAWPKYRIVCPFDHFWVERTVDESSIGFLVQRESESGDMINYSAFNITSSDRVSPFVFAAFTFSIKVSEGGALALGDDGTFYTRCKVEPIVYEMGFSQQQCETALLTHAACLFDVLGLLNCKNVSLTAQDTDPKQVRIATKRHGASGTGYRYHVLTVRPPGAKSDAPGVEIGTMPRHVCRGHFAEYGPEFGKGLLFGRLSGRFFIPPHMKGKKENGVVEKDYQVSREAAR